MTQLEFFTAPQSLETMPEEYRKQAGFISIAQYPRGFEPEEDEFGMLVEKGRIVKRMFSSSHDYE